MCLPTGNNLGVLNLFGDGLLWGGLSLVYLLRQARRFEVCVCV